MKKYRLYFDQEIQEVDVEKDTKWYVWVNGSREQKYTNNILYMDNYGDAYNEGVSRLKDKIENIKISLRRAENNLSEFVEKYKK